MEDFHDELDEHIAESLRDPAYAAAYEEARARMDRSVSMRCHWGNCVVDVDPLERRVFGGMGPMMCPCDHLPGWRSGRYEGLSRPAVPVKVAGRHGSRVQRSRRRHALPDWGADWEWLPARCQS